MPEPLTDHYATLGVAADAGPDAIKKAYRALALRYHPDRNPGDAEAEARFKEVASAYEVLGDPARRRSYDLSLRVGHVVTLPTSAHAAAPAPAVGVDVTDAATLERLAEAVRVVKRGRVAGEQLQSGGHLYSIEMRTPGGGAPRDVLCSDGLPLEPGFGDLDARAVAAVLRDTTRIARQFEDLAQQRLDLASVTAGIRDLLHEGDSVDVGDAVYSLTRVPVEGADSVLVLARNGAVLEPLPAGARPALLADPGDYQALYMEEGGLRDAVGELRSRERGVAEIARTLALDVDPGDDFVIDAVRYSFEVFIVRYGVNEREVSLLCADSHPLDQTGGTLVDPAARGSSLAVLRRLQQDVPELTAHFKELSRSRSEIRELFSHVIGSLRDGDVARTRTGEVYDVRRVAVAARYTGRINNELHVCRGDLVLSSFSGVFAAPGVRRPEADECAALKGEITRDVLPQLNAIAAQRRREEWEQRRRQAAPRGGSSFQGLMGGPPLAGPPAQAPPPSREGRRRMFGRFLDGLGG